MYQIDLWIGLNQYTFSSECTGGGCDGEMTWLGGTVLDCSSLGGCGSIFDRIQKDKWSYFDRSSRVVKDTTSDKEVVCETTCTTIPRQPRESISAL